MFLIQWSFKEWSIKYDELWYWQSLYLQSSTWYNAFTYILQLKPYNRAGGVAQVFEYLPSRCEALSSNPNTAKKPYSNYEIGMN
jgi:hypothetical protein